MIFDVAFDDGGQKIDVDFANEDQNINPEFDHVLAVPGLPGKDGASAYEIATQNGFEGSEAEWLESLRGKSGYTPIRGTDYWTAADKSQIVSDVLAELPVYNGEVADA